MPITLTPVCRVRRRETYLTECAIRIEWPSGDPASEKQFELDAGRGSIDLAVPTWVYEIWPEDEAKPNWMVIGNFPAKSPEWSTAFLDVVNPIHLAVLEVPRSDVCAVSEDAADLAIDCMERIGRLLADTKLGSLAAVERDYLKLVGNGAGKLIAMAIWAKRPKESFDA